MTDSPRASHSDGAELAECEYGNRLAYPGSPGEVRNGMIIRSAGGAGERMGMEGETREWGNGYFSGGEPGLMNRPIAGFQSRRSASVVFVAWGHRLFVGHVSAGVDGTVFLFVKPKMWRVRPDGGWLWPMDRSCVQVTRQAENSSPRGRTSPVVDVSPCAVTPGARIFPLHFGFEF
jgi:hypothetical protein